jgi:hypothetical protein
MRENALLAKEIVRENGGEQQERRKKASCGKFPGTR